MNKESGLRYTETEKFPFIGNCFAEDLRATMGYGIVINCLWFGFYNYEAIIRFI